MFVNFFLSYYRLFNLLTDKKKKKKKKIEEDQEEIVYRWLTTKIVDNDMVFSLWQLWRHTE